MEAKVLLAISLVLLTTGVVLIGLFASWPAAVGVFLVVWGNNLDAKAREARRNKV